MKKWISAVAVVAVIGVIALSAQDPQHPEPPALGLQWERGFAHAARTGGSSNLLYHNGPIVSTPTVQAIYWGTNWSNSSFTADKQTGLASFYNGWKGSSYANTNTEYNDSTGAFVTTGMTNLNAIVDTSAAKSGNNTSAILAEVCKVVTNPQAGAYYPVYTDLKRAGNFCAYHSWGSCGGTPIQFGFFWNLDGDAGCDPQSDVTTETQGLAALANVSAHELSEMLTDPNGNAWYDASGAENGDKCAWKFKNDVSFTNSTTWKLQMEWSNAANGCIQSK